MSLPIARFDPRTKFALLLGVNFLLLASHSLALEVMLFLYCEVVSLVSRRAKNAARYLVVFLVMLLVDRLMAPQLSGMAFASS